MPLPETLNRMRRKRAQWMDQLAAKARRKFRGGNLPVEWNGNPHFALLTVNFHSTRYLKMMLLSLCEQNDLQRLERLVIVDNGSQDGGLPFLQALAERCEKVLLVENRRWNNHARGMRLGLAALDEYDGEKADSACANVLLFCDPDVLFLRTDTLSEVAQVFSDPAVSHAGELRTHLFSLAEAQASFLAVRRDWAARRDISPWVNHGSPAWWMQRDLIKRGGKAAHFPGNEEGYILHRGRSAVAAVRTFDPSHPYATARHREPHYMGRPGGDKTWAAMEQSFADWLDKSREKELIENLAARLS